MIVEPGAIVLFHGEAKVISNGSVCMNGTVKNPIWIKTLNSEKQGMFTLSTSCDSLIMTHVKIENTRIVSKLNKLLLYNISFVNTIKLEWNQSLLTAHGGSFILSNSVIESNNTGEGILCHNIDYPLIENNIFNNVPDAVEFIQCTHGRILNNKISYT